jgi:hypothetical protein
MGKESVTKAKTNPMRNILRVDKGHHSWRVVMRRMHQHLRQHFTDSIYGGKDLALTAAMAWRDQREAELSGVDYVVWQREWMRTCNKSGTVGVYRNINCKKRGDRIVKQAQWIGYWQNTNGKRSVRSFNVSKYGEEEAKQLAIRARQKGMADVARQLQSTVTPLPVTANPLHEPQSHDAFRSMPHRTVPVPDLGAARTSHAGCEFL